MIDRLMSEYSHNPHVAKEYSDAMSQDAMWIVESDEKPLDDKEAYLSAVKCQKMDNKPSGTMPHYHSILYVKRKKRY
eukprot:4839177-Ditylum_brightwellii.AAC.1